MKELATTKNNLPSTEISNQIIIGNLTKDDVLNSNALTVLCKDIIKASTGLKIKNIEKKDSGKRLREIINRTIAESGFTYTAKEINFMTLAVIDDIFRDYAMLTCEDIELAFRMGVRGKLGDIFGVSVRQMNLWLDKYVLELKKEAYNELKLIDKPKEREYSQEEILALDKSWLEKLANAYKEFLKFSKFNYEDLNNRFYDLCDRQKIHRLNKEQKKEYHRLAKQLYIESKNPMNANGRTERDEFKNVIKDITDGSKFQESIIRNKAKKLAVEYIFIQFQKNNTTYSDFKESLKKAHEKDKQEREKL